MTFSNDDYIDEHPCSKQNYFMKTQNTIKYPSSLKDIPKNRQNEMEANIRWFRRFPPLERLRISEREWEETQIFIKTYKGSIWKQKKK